MSTKQADAIRQKLAKIQQTPKTESSSRPIIQEVATVNAPKKTGRKKHRLDGVEYARISAGLPVDLKTEMDIAIRTTHKDYPTIDTFVAQAVRVFLNMKR